MFFSLNIFNIFKLVPILFFILFEELILNNDYFFSYVFTFIDFF